MIEWWRVQICLGSHELWCARGDYLARVVLLLSCLGVLLVPVALFLLGILIWRAL